MMRKKNCVKDDQGRGIGSTIIGDLKAMYAEILRFLIAIGSFTHFPVYHYIVTNLRGGDRIRRAHHLTTPSTKGIHIVIDGFNLIRQSSRFSESDPPDLKSGGHALVKALAAYKKDKAYRITVVFDGKAACTGMPCGDVHKCIAMRYSRHSETAGAVIKRMAAQEKEKLMVVTSDREIVRYAEAMGAATIGAAEFEDRLMTSQ